MVLRVSMASHSDRHQVAGAETHGRSHLSVVTAPSALAGMLTQCVSMAYA